MKAKPLVQRRAVIPAVSPKQHEQRSLPTLSASSGIAAADVWTRIDRIDRIGHKFGDISINAPNAGAKAMRPAASHRPPATGFSAQTGSEVPAAAASEGQGGAVQPIQMLVSSGDHEGAFTGAGGDAANAHHQQIRQALDDFHNAGSNWDLFGTTQGTSTRRLQALSRIEHASYDWLRTNNANRDAGANAQRAAIEGLLNQVQTEHQSVIATEVAKDRVPYFRGQENMGATVLARTQADWRSIVSGTGRLSIDEATAEEATERPEGFKTEQLAMIHRLMGGAWGRTLIHDVATGPQDVHLQPRHPVSLAAGNVAAAVTETDAKATGTAVAPVAGPQRPSAIKVEPRMTDTAYKSRDDHGREILSPAFVLLGHEMIHARHNQRGMNFKDLDAANYAAGQPLAHWDNREEHGTIDLGPGVTENRIREEHGLVRREGHG